MITKTNIHFRQCGKHRIMSLMGVFTYDEVKEVLQDNKIPLDNSCFMLTFI